MTTPSSIWLAAWLLPLGATLALACTARTGFKTRATADGSMDLPPNVGAMPDALGATDPLPASTDLLPSPCGNGQIDPGEACDDGNMTSGDGCAAGCMAIEQGWNCHAPGKRCTPLCGDRAGTGSGTSNGPFTVRGHVLDGSGAPVIGARLELSGDAAAVRYTDFTGGFTFHLDGGDYRLNATANCPLSPAVLDIHALTSDATYEFTADTQGTACVTCPLRGRASLGFIRTLKRAGVSLIDVDALVLAWGTEAVAADLEKGREQPLGSGGWLCDLSIAELPAIALQIPGHRSGAPDEQGRTDWDLLSLGTNIAVGDTMVSFQARVDPATPTETIDLFFATARNFTPEEIPELFSP